MNLITVITAQAALYSSELLTAWGVTGATTIAIAQAAALTLLVVAAIIAVVAVVAALYYCAQKVASAFKAKAPAPDAPAVAPVAPPAVAPAPAPVAVAIKTESLANWDEKREAYLIAFKQSFSSEDRYSLYIEEAGKLEKGLGSIPVYNEDNQIEFITLDNFREEYDSYLQRANDRLAVHNESGEDLNEESEEDENEEECKRSKP